MYSCINKDSDHPDLIVPYMAIPHGPNQNSMFVCFSNMYDIINAALLLRKLRPCFSANGTVNGLLYNSDYNKQNSTVLTPKQL